MDFSSLADDFFVNLNVQTAMDLPQGRETVLHFFEAVQKQFPSMTGFYQRDGRESVLEGDREGGSYRWAELHSRRMCAGFFNPPDVDTACYFHQWLLERSVVYLGLSGLDIEAMDLMFGFNLDFVGNRDEIVAHALLGDGPLAQFSSAGPTLEYQPDVVIGLDEECYMQGRLSVETRCSSFQVRTGQYEDEPISVYFTARRYPAPGDLIEVVPAFHHQRNVCEEITARLLVPQILQPISETIAANQ